MRMGADISLWVLVAFGLMTVVASGRWWLRVRRACVEYDTLAVTVVGLFWTRRIDRRAIRMVETELDWPTIYWGDKRGRPRWTILTPIATGGGWHGILLLPDRSLDERRRYLRRLKRWAANP
jgi:hypothetical protein